MSPEGTQDGDRTSPPLPLAVTTTVNLEKIQDSGPSKLNEVHSKGMISLSPESCIFPYTEKH